MIAALLGFGALAGTATMAAAQTASTSDGSTTSTVVATAQKVARGMHVGSNGKTEELLTGDLKAKAEAAALAAVPGGTIERVETDADGGVYEAHMTDASGAHTTVIFDANFNVTEKQTGGPGGHGGPRGDKDGDGN